MNILITPEDPPGFVVDGNVRCGDSLVGLSDLSVLAHGIPDVAYKPLKSDSKETAKYFEKRNKAERDGQGSLDFAAGVSRLPAAAPMASEAKVLRALSEDDPQEIAAKRKKFEAMLMEPQRWKLRIASDLYIGAFFSPKIEGVPANRNTVTIPTTANVWEVLTGVALPGSPVGDVQNIASEDGAFHWPLEFPDVMASGGFDVVIGNPPYVRHELLSEALKRYLKFTYAAFDGIADLYVYFYERGFRLLRSDGRLSYIVTNKWLKAGYAEALRNLFVKESCIEFIADFGHAKHFFPEVDVFPSILVVHKPLANERASLNTRVCVIPSDAVPEKGLSAAIAAGTYLLPRGHFKNESWILEPPDVASLLDKITENGVPLAELAGVKPYRGVLTGLNDAFLIDTPTRNRLIEDDPGCADIIKPFVRGQDIERWFSPWNGLWMIFTRRGIDIESFPSVKNHLQAFRARLEPKPAGWAPSTPDEVWPGRKEGNYAWYEIQDSTEYWAEFEKPKIIFQELSWWQTFQINDSNLYLPNTAYFLTSSDPWLLSVLNAPTFWWWSWRKAVHGKDEALRLIKEFIVTFPVPIPSNDARQQAESLSASLRRLTRDVWDSNTATQQWLRDEFGLTKFGRSLSEPYWLELDGFVQAVDDALPKSRKPTPIQIARLKEKYAEILTPARRSKAEITVLEETLSDLVNSAYGLTPDEVRLMWRTAPPRMSLDPVQELCRLNGQC